MRSPEHSEAMPSGQPETTGARIIRPTDGRVAMIPEAAIADGELSPMELRVLCGIGVFCAGGRGGWPKQQTVADLLGVSRETISRAVKTLRDRGHLKAIQKFRKSGGKRENHYTIPLDRVLNEAEANQGIVDDLVDDLPDTAPDDVTNGSHRESPGSHRDVAPAVTSTKEEQTNLNIPPSPRKRGDENAKEIENAFDQIWAIWPEHGRKHSPGRELCLRAFAKASTGIPLASMIAAVKAFVAQVDPRYAPGLSKWLREGKAEPWLPKATAITIPGGASALSTTTPPPTDADALKCLGELQARFGQTKVAAWFNDAVWDGKLVRLKSAYHAQRVTTDFSGVLREHGFTAVEGSAAA